MGYFCRFWPIKQLDSQPWLRPVWQRRVVKQFQINVCCAPRTPDDPDGYFSTTYYNLNPWLSIVYVCHAIYSIYIYREREGELLMLTPSIAALRNLAFFSMFERDVDDVYICVHGGFCMGSDGLIAFNRVRSLIIFVCTSHSNFQSSFASTLWIYEHVSPLVMLRCCTSKSNFQPAFASQLWTFPRARDATFCCTSQSNFQHTFDSWQS